ncbi:MAG: tetratricopeptide repeat protein, partial [Rickettsiales bacterium]|nr:tetratricopeptide repeat protein [Rickettsiales bacterium]
KNPERLMKMALLALEEQLDDVATAESALETILEHRPDDMNVHRALGRLAYSAGKYTKAKVHLERYLQNTQGDYLSNYYVGEIYANERDEDKATRYFQRAAEQLAALPAKDIDARWTEASLLFRLKQIDKSIDLFRELLEKNPGNKNIRADYADVLIQAGKYKQAEEILKQ